MPESRVEDASFSVLTSPCHGKVPIFPVYPAVVEVELLRVEARQKIPAVAQLTKTGFLFILNRETGRPIFGIEERPVPVSDALPGDSPSATQPFPVKPPSLARTSFRRENLATVTTELQKYCEGLFDNLPGGLHSGGPFTHYSTEPSVIFPSSIGGGNWNPPSFNPSLGYLFVNIMDFGSLNVMVKNEEDRSYRRVNYKGVNRFWDAEHNLPCNQPPRGQTLCDQCQHRRDCLGNHTRNHRQLSAREAAHRAAGGSVATAGGLVFIGERTSGDSVVAFAIP